MLVDSHCHLNMLDLANFNGDIANVVQAAKDNGVSHILNVATNMANFPEVIKTAEQFENVYASIGIHPDDETVTEPSVEEFLQLGSHEKVVAIGETGLDYFHGILDVTKQQLRFIKHIHVAKTLKKPLIVHTRQARADTIDLLQQENAAEVGGVLHCFTEDWAMAKQALDLNFYISFSGIITFKNAADLRDVVKEVPLEKMLIETDSPYLAPMPFRGKQNQPAYVRYVAEQVAAIKNIPVEQVIEQTGKNFFKLFM